MIFSLLFLHDADKALLTIEVLLVDRSAIRDLIISHVEFELVENLLHGL